MRISDWSSDVCSSDLGMARPVALEVADDRRADQVEVADRIEHLVAHEFVAEAQALGVEDLLAVHHDGVVQRAAAGEAHGAHLLDVLCEAEGAGARDIALEGALAHLGEPRSEEHTSEL